MVRPHHRGNRLLHLPGLSADPRPQRTRACGYSGSNPASALRSPPSSSSSSSCCAAVIYLFPMFVIVSRVLFLSPTCESLSYASFIYLPPSYVTRIVCLARRSSICPLCSSSCCASLSISYVRVIVLRVVHLSVSVFVILLRVPFYLLLVSHCIARRSSICLSCALSVLWSIAGAEGRKGYQTRWRVGRIKGWT
jgi:hypothetical protein